MTSIGITTEVTPSDSIAVLRPIENLRQPQQAADEYGKGQKDDFELEDDSDDNDSCEELDDSEDSTSRRGRQALEASGSTAKKSVKRKKDTVTKTGDAGDDKKEEEEKNEEEEKDVEEEKTGE